MAKRVLLIQRITGLTAHPDEFSLVLAWSDGTATAVSLKDFIARKSLLAPLAHPALFAQAAIGEDGWEITWDGGGDLSLASSTLQVLAAGQSDDPAQRFDAWMIRNGLSPDEASTALGISRRAVLHYRANTKPTVTTSKLIKKRWH
jgi:hypothetical protein